MCRGSGWNSEVEHEIHWLVLGFGWHLSYQARTSHVIYITNISGRVGSQVWFIQNSEHSDDHDTKRWTAMSQNYCQSLNHYCFEILWNPRGQQHQIWISGCNFSFGCSKIINLKNYDQDVVNIENFERKTQLDHKIWNFKISFQIGCYIEFRISDFKKHPKN